jgi:hypothetical protein
MNWFKKKKMIRVTILPKQNEKLLDWIEPETNSHIFSNGDFRWAHSIGLCSDCKGMED